MFCRWRFGDLLVYWLLDGNVSWWIKSIYKVDYFWLPRNEINWKKKIMIWRREIDKPIIFIEAVSNGFSWCRVARWLVANRKQVGDDATCWLLVSRNPEVGFHQVFFVSRFCPRFLLSSFCPRLSGHVQSNTYT